MKIAVCILNSPRAIDYAIPTIYENIIDHLDADVFCMFTIGEHNDDLDRISRVKKRVIEKQFWNPKELISFLPKIFWDTHIKFAQSFFEDKYNNYLSPIYVSKNSTCPRWFGLPPRYTVFKLLKMMNKYIDQYDYFILLRSDLYFLFPLINRDIIKNNKKYILNYDTHDFQGINAELLIMSRENFIKWTEQIKYFTKKIYIEQLIECMKNLKTTKHAEVCTKCIVDIEQFRIKSISTNSFIIRDNITEKMDKNSISKYYKHDHYFDAIREFELWNSGYRWLDSEQKINLDSVQ